MEAGIYETEMNFEDFVATVDRDNAIRSAQRQVGRAREANTQDPTNDLSVSEQLVVRDSLARGRKGARATGSSVRTPSSQPATGSRVRTPSTQPATGSRIRTPSTTPAEGERWPRMTSLRR